MKKIFNITLLSLVLGLLAGIYSCTNLDETVYDTIPADQFGKKPAEINAIIAPIYKTLKNVFPGDIFLLSEQAGDMAITPTRVGGDWWDGGVHTWYQGFLVLYTNRLFWKCSVSCRL